MNPIKRSGNTPPSSGSVLGYSSPSSIRKAMQRSGISWTDDLPVCELSDVGVAPNIVYLENNRVLEAHPYEDCAFNFR